MSRERALRLQQRGLADWIAMLGSSSEGASVVRRGGVTASIVPATPQRSICNSVAYTDAGELIATLDELGAIYKQAGIAAWTVWAPEFDLEAIAALEAAGHKLDGSPVAMSLELVSFAGPELADLDWDNEVEPATLGRLNDIAYGLPGEGIADALAISPAGVRLYQARIAGEPACVLGTIDHDRQAPQQRRGSATPPSDLGFYFVATHPEHRGLGLASRLMTAALDDARERGLETSSLQSSPMGRSVYRRLGYSDDFALNMYERRR